MTGQQGEKIEDNANRLQNEGVSRFTLIPVVVTPAIDAGDYIKIDYYVAGRVPYGRQDEVQRSRLSVNVGGILTESSKVSLSITQKLDKSGQRLQIQRVNRFDKMTTYTPTKGMNTFSVKIPEAFFFVNSELDDPNNLFDSPPLLAEVSDDVPPCRLTMKTKKPQRSGRYVINSTLIYEQNDKVNIDKVVNEIYINSWYERNQRWVTLTLVFTALASLLYTPVKDLFVNFIF